MKKLIWELGWNIRIICLEGTDLSKANFTSADLRGADLTNANLENACLEDANLAGAILDNANLTGAMMPDFLVPRFYLGIQLFFSFPGSTWEYSFFSRSQVLPGNTAFEALPRAGMKAEPPIPHSLPETRNEIR